MTDPNAQVREIVERPIAELVALGLQGGDRAACRLLAHRYAGRLELLDDLEGLKRLHGEIEDAIEAITAEAGLQ